MNTQLDHMVIAATDLDSGVAYIKEKLGVDIPPGGRHEMMGTHNRVMSLGNGIYLEVIAVNPDMDPPPYPRWFGLDDPHVRRSLKESPRLLTWAVNSNSLDSLVAGSSVSLGIIKDAERDDLKWQVALSEDGRMPGAGFLPLCIQWMVDFHPSERMEFCGWDFVSLELFHPRLQWLEHALDSIGARHLVKAHEIEDGLSPEIRLVLSGTRGEAEFSSNGST